ncbi:unnamed protein product [Cyclocybe aegerita]|uniref:Uncharacterized protein n=1 Tax=Cyclocybe aegerita TaxID=1973307 RepID=A0A8S0VZV8_CYCAE|nr:unnamed protein product [Cyclocybe aegerita]
MFQDVRRFITTRSRSRSDSPSSLVYTTTSVITTPSFFTIPALPRPSRLNRMLSKAKLSPTSKAQTEVRKSKSHFPLAPFPARPTTITLLHYLHPRRDPHETLDSRLSNQPPLHTFLANIFTQCAPLLPYCIVSHAQYIANVFVHSAWSTFLPDDDELHQVETRRVTGAAVCREHGKALWEAGAGEIPAPGSPAPKRQGIPGIFSSR